MLQYKCGDHPPPQPGGWTEPHKEDEPKKEEPQDEKKEDKQ